MKARTPRAPRLRLEVTQEQIDYAIPRDSQHCMIAEALKGVVPDAYKVAVDLGTIRFTDRSKQLRYTYLTPRVAQVALVNFDRSVKPVPFSFQLKGGHVTRAGQRDARKPLEKSATPAQQKQRAAALVKANELGKTKIVRRDGSNSSVPDRVGGKAPPLQKTNDGVPFSRRRAFGLRGLEY